MKDAYPVGLKASQINGVEICYRVADISRPLFLKVDIVAVV
jgi:hypothetical protein